MHRRRRRALIAAALSCLACAASAGAVQVDYVGTHVWREQDAGFGGFSGLELSQDGSRYWALSDRAVLRWGSIERDEAGRIRGMTTAGQARLQDSEGKPLQPGWRGDSEGLAVAADGAIYVSFEGLNRVARYDDPDAPATRLPAPDAFAEWTVNAGLEALAITEDGTLLTLPERSGAHERPFPIWRFRDGVWDQPWSLPRTDRWLPVGADIGPDGRFYLLERDFLGVLGFASRVRRFTLTEDGLQSPELLLQTAPMQYDNLEGIAVWRDAQGLRLTMISDDNFLLLQRTELVEYRLRD